MKNSEQKGEHIIRRMLTDRAEDAPADALKYAKNLYRTRAIEPKASIVQRVLAVMRVDLAPNQTAFGERSTAERQARQMLFDSGENAVDLRITNVKNGFDIRGQILGEGFENGEAEVANDKTSVKTKIDKMNGFHFSSLPTGKYTLTIRSKSAEILIEQLDIR